MIKLYNTASRRLETFQPLRPGKVKLYTCGPTVYDYMHIGNWLSYIRWDLLVRTLRQAGYQVNRVMNITDVGHLVSDADEGEDKMLQAARRQGVGAKELARFYCDDFLAGMRRLNLLPPEHLAKATDYIAQQIELIQRLESGGYAYRTDDGIYFDSAKFSGYGAMARLNIAGQQAGARVAINGQKRSPADFALWKFSPVSLKRDGDMEWDSPWGRGFPGWHIECSAIALDLLGPTLDIHAGGIDHIPIHHTNEIAQSEAATGQPFARYWLHSNFLLVNGQKISKSLGNGYTLQDLQTKGFAPMEFKLFALQSHFQSEANFSWELLESARQRLSDFYAAAERRFQPENEGGVNQKEFGQAAIKITKALQNNLNSPEALAAFSQLAARLQDRGVASLKALEVFLTSAENLLGLNLDQVSDIAEDTKRIIAKRQAARQQQDWDAADELRQQLLKQGVAVQDTPNGPRWRRVSGPAKE